MHANLLKDNPSANISRMHMLFISLGLGLCMPFVATASEIAVNMRLNFNESQTFEQGIDRLLAFDTATSNFRFLNDRLGTFSSGSATFTLNGLHSISLNDPGVESLPASQRPLLRVDASASASGGLLTAETPLNISATWNCPNTALKCSANEVFSIQQTITPSLATPTNGADLLQAIRLQASASSTPLVEGVSLNSGMLHLSGTWQVNASFTAKTPTQYVEDALTATNGTGTVASASRWAAAAADVQSLRNAVWTDLAVANSLKASRTPELENAQRLLTVARDSASLLAAGNTVGSNFATNFALTRQLWDVAASVDSGLGRSLAGSTSDNLSSSDIPAELAVMRMMINRSNEADFVSGLEQALANPLTTGPNAALTLDGALIGLTDATLTVYYLGNAESGQVEINLAGADKYALWRTGFDRISLLEGANPGLTVLGSGEYSGTSIRKVDGEVYVGEGFGGLLYLSGQATPSRLQLNNFYSDQLLVVASWAVTPVPEPSQAWLFAMGLPLLIWRRRAH